MPRLRLLVLASPAAAVALGLGFAGVSAAAQPLPSPTGTTTTSVATLTTPTTTFRVSAAAAPVTSASTPSGSASGAGIRIDPLDTCVSCTGAGAGPGTAGAQGTSLRLLGHDVEAGRSSGNQSGRGALVALPANPLLDLALFDWVTAAHSTSTSSNAHSRTAVADLAVGGGKVATVAVLESTSDAAYTTSPSGWRASGSAQNNGAVANVGQGALVIILLHSGTSSSGHGDAYVASVNGNEILSSQQTNGGIPITIPGVATVDLLAVSASGGSGASTGSAAVGTVSGLGGTPGEAAGIAAGSAGGASGPMSSVSAAAAAPSAATPPSTANPGVSTPMTGAGIGLGLLLLTGGAGALAVSRLRRRPS